MPVYAPPLGHGCLGLFLQLPGTSGCGCLSPAPLTAVSWESVSWESQPWGRRPLASGLGWESAGLPSGCVKCWEAGEWSRWQVF